MLPIKQRSTDNLLKAAKRLMNQDASQNSQNILHTVSDDEDIHVVENKRSREAPLYVDLSPSQFMSWWITSTGCKRKASNILLHYWKIKFNIDIPMDYRTLLHTPKLIPKYMEPGSYIHLGVRQALHRILSENQTNSSVNELLMQFFIDGVSISRSTKSDLWVIMVNVRNKSFKRQTPKVIGVYLGEKKPQDFNELLWAFVMELLDLLDTGIEYNGKNISLKILNFVLDAKARASCKCIKNVNGYFGCDVCLSEGDYINFRMAFLDTDAGLRNDADYRARIYEDYHHKESVLEMLPIDMIDAFPHDYLHSALLGVMKWILTYFRDSPKTLSSSDYIEIKKRIQIFLENQPVEFQRNLRAFTEDLGNMKGTEFRQYLLFVFPLLLKGIASERIIGNFLKLQIASIIFSHKRFATFYGQADKLMKIFLREFEHIYDPCHVTYVFHSLSHMKKFVDLYGSWDNFSTFEYESYNSTIKNLLKGHAMPLTQIANRIVEIYQVPLYDFKRSSKNIEIKDRQDDGSFSQLRIYDMCFKPNDIGQNLVLLKSGQCVKLLSITQKRSRVVLSGIPFKHRSSVYDCIDTTRFNIFKSKQIFDRPIAFDAEDIDGKMWKLDIPDSSFSAYYPLYVEDGKSFSREQ